MTQPDPVKSIDIIGRTTIDEIKLMWAGVEADYKALEADKDKLIDAIEAATGEQADNIGAFKTRMGSIKTSITALHSNVTTVEHADDGKPIPAFLKQPLRPPPDRASIVSTLGDAIGVNGKSKQAEHVRRGGGREPDEPDFESDEQTAQGPSTTAAERRRPDQDAD